MTERPKPQEIRLHELDLYVTMKCNLTCDFCSVSANEYGFDEELSLERLNEIITEATQLGLKELHISGGEPSLRKDLEDIIAHAKSLDLHTRIITNGFKLPRQRIEKLRDVGLDDIMISIDGFRETHNKFRGNRYSFDRAIEVVKNSVDVGFNTRVSTVVYQENIEEIAPFLAWIDRYGIDIYSAFLGSPLGRGREFRLDSIISAAEWRAFCRSINETIDAYDIQADVVLEQGFQYADGIKVDRSVLNGRGTGCATLLESYDFLILRSDGNIFQCVFFVKEGRSIGSVAEAGLRDVLVKAREEAIYEKFTKPRDACVSCSQQEECGTGCPGYAYLYTGDWLKTDPRCDKKINPMPQHFPLCPILKLNARSGELGGSTEQALSTR